MLTAHRGDWMRKALGFAHLDGKVMAEYLGVDDATISRWLNGKRTPGKQTLRLWAIRTGVPMSYLETGIIPKGWNGPRDDGPSEDFRKITVRLLAPFKESNVTRINFRTDMRKAA